MFVDSSTVSSSSTPLRLGVVGCGAIVREAHLPALVGNPQVTLTVLSDKDIRNATLAKKQFALPAVTTTSVGDFRGKADAALVAVPPRFHAPVTIELLEMGIDVLCEKPLATTAADAERMIATAEKSGRVLAVGLMSRFHSNNDILRALVRGGELGEILEVVAEFGAPLDWTMTTASYYSRANTAGGVFFDAGVHMLDRVLWLFGEIRDIEYEDDSYGGVESNAELRGVLTIDGRDVPCRFTFSWTHHLTDGIRVVGSAATAMARWTDPDTVHVSREIGGEYLNLAVTAQRGGRGAASNPYRDQIRDLVVSVQTRRPPFVPASTTVGALRIIEHAYSVRKPMAQPWVEGLVKAT
jgi:predicted dehydrogenase